MKNLFKKLFKKKDSDKDILNWFNSGISIYYRDSNLNKEIASQYYIGQIVRSDLSLDMSHVCGRLIKNTRYIIFSSKAANFHELSNDINPYLNTINFNSFFKVIDILGINIDSSYIVLLHIPKQGIGLVSDKTNRLFIPSISNKPFETFLSDKAIEKIKSENLEIIPDLETDDWNKRTNWPVGFDDANKLNDIQNDFVLNDKQQELSNIISQLTSN